MGKLIRCISEDGTLTVMAADTTDIVNRAQEIHGTSAVVSAALGRLLTAASLMGSALKGADDSVTLRINGNGPAGTVLAASDSHGNVRGYAVNSVVELPLNDKGKLDVYRRSRQGRLFDRYKRPRTQGALCRSGADSQRRNR
mgnify:CR=1 FL=1